MNQIKYHIITIISVVLFSFLSALTINLFVEYILFDTVDVNRSHKHRSIRRSRSVVVPFRDYENSIIESGFFKIPSEDPEVVTEEVVPDTVIDELKLVGTISGPRRIARALVQKRGERDAVIYKPGSDIFGYRLLRIKDTSIYLRHGETTSILDIYDDRNWSRSRRSGSRRSAKTSRSSTINKTISRAEVKQKVLNNLDNAMRGLRAGPYRRNGKVQGYRLIRIRPYNILYKLGMRSGDVVKRINGHRITGTKKLYSLWESLKDAAKVSVDVNRRGRNLHFNYSIRN